jgi:hypothetical protein
MYGKRNYRRRVYKGAKRAPLRKRARVPKPTTKMVKSIVKKEIARGTENKEVCQVDQYMEIYQAGNTSITGNTVVTLSPTIAQSVNENGRIGNSVKLKNLFLRGYMSVYPQNTLSVISNSSAPEQIGQWNVRLFIGKLKFSIAAPTTADFDQLLRTGGSVSPFNSTTSLSLLRTVNTEYFTVYYDKIHKIGFQNGNNNSTATGLHNNDYKLSKLLKINCTKMFKKTLIFNDNSNQPTNCGLFMWAGLVDSLGSALTSSDALVQLAYDLEYSYEDA